MTGVSTLESPPQPAPPTRYTVALARDETDVRAAQRLRHDVFAGEMGALLSTPQPGYDVDPFDAYCDHLLVRDTTTGQVVGTYRLLPPERAAIAGRLYAEGEFDLTALAPIRPGLVEVGRSCVHPDHRDGTVIGLIWAGLARYMVDRGHEWLAGCCSIPLADGGALASATWERVREKNLAPQEHRVRPLLPWIPRAGLPAAPRTELPALLRGYLRLGAQVCGAPAHDPDFGVADLYVLLSMRRVSPRYLRHFLSLVPA
ncbi:GNAT family N-acetyltransferase [Streptomyces sp. NPDC088337]|uniref:GNAT family N-acetyltransferase n=1 Tax=unclassified Streptomyces TaxID=2593676 RepID=UPI002DD930F0|nr:GNAT family N-acyltransferase [Streptomyces sp. NBC_01788]WSB30343.1 GNAT family N-acetyltransferase [Streptomyces sp. NBC_01788]